MIKFILIYFLIILSIYMYNNYYLVRLKLSEWLLFRSINRNLDKLLTHIKENGKNYDKVSQSMKNLIRKLEQPINLE